jgi:hypothetical protein
MKTHTLDEVQDKLKTGAKINPRGTRETNWRAKSSDFEN